MKAHSAALGVEGGEGAVHGTAGTGAAEGTVSPNSLTFTAGNGLLPQTVVVTGVDDAVADGTVFYTIVTDPAVSGDTSYGGLDAPNVSVSNVDDENWSFLTSRLGLL